MNSAREYFNRLWQKIKSFLIQDVPEEIAICEFECRGKECIKDRWQACKRRLSDVYHQVEHSQKHEELNTSSTTLPSPAHQPKPSPSWAIQAGVSLLSPVLLSKSCDDCRGANIQLRKVTQSPDPALKLWVSADIPMGSCPNCGAPCFTAQTMHEPNASRRFVNRLS